MIKKRFDSIKDTKLTQIAIYIVLTVVASFLIIHVIRNFSSVMAVVKSAAGFLGAILKPLAMGFALAYLIYPLVKIIQGRLERLSIYKNKGKSARVPAVAICLLLGALLIFVFLSLVISAVSREARFLQVGDITRFIQSLSSSIRHFIDDFTTWLEDLEIWSGDVAGVLNDINGKISGLAQNLAGGIAGSISSLPKYLTNLLFAVIFEIYFLLDADGIMSYWDRVLKAFTNEKAYRNVHIIIDDADRVFSGYIRGQFLDAIIMAAMVGVALSVLNVKFAVIIGVLVGIGNLIPYFGPIVAYGATGIVCIINGDIKKLLIAIVVLFVIQTVDGNVINPKLLSKSISVHPLFVIASLILGSTIGGLFGMLLAVPVAAIVKIQFERAVNHLLRKKDLEEKDAQHSL